ncbi:hypothetical protein SDC9_124982 [bioreactor metagenome]|uniref:Acid-resistance membrane protein n=1 Tax=bioreactor metagenome TaxID=1076179 RepID=A0A645CMH0_9ZZZZ|nr:DUF308 domain-containing protein [Oscillibacter sp.]
MNGFFKKIKINSLLNAVVYTALGLVLILWPVTSASMLCLALGAVLLLCGIIDVILFLTHRDGSLYSGGMLVLGIILAALGAWIIASPQLVAVLVPRVIGVLICIHGLGDIGDAVTLHRADYPRWSAALILGLVTLALGAVLIFYSFTVLSTIVRIIGFFLLYDGVSDIWITRQVSKATKQAAKDAEAQANAVDADFTEQTKSNE